MAKCSAPASERKQPQTCCLSLGIRISPCVRNEPKSSKRKPRKIRKVTLLSQLNTEGISLRSHPFHEQT